MDLVDILKSAPGLLPSFVDVAAHALEDRGHVSGVSLACTSLGVATAVPLAWTTPDPRARSSYQEPERTQYGAVAISIIALPAGLGLIRATPRRIRVNGRLAGTRVDYFLGDPNDPTGVVTAVLEVAGLAAGSLPALVNGKVTQAQASPYRGLGYDVYASGCVFARPEVELRKV